jgi:hypothetical protein
MLLIIILMEGSVMANYYFNGRVCHGRYRMVVGFTTIYAISAYRH